MKSIRGRSIRPGLGLLLVLSLPGAGVGAEPKAPKYAVWEQGGRLSYESDARGNLVPDFSSAGYMGGGVAIPDVPVVVVVAPAEGDGGPRIQAALDDIARRPADGRGIRGAVLLLKGRHGVAGSLEIKTGGVVLRGQGDGPGGTSLVALGTGRRPLIRIEGQGGRGIVPGTTSKVVDAYVPVGSSRLTLSGPHGFRPGDTIVVEHPSTAAWIASLGMDRFPPGEKGSYLSWPTGKMDVRIERVVAAVDGPIVTLDAPLSMALDASLAEATVSAQDWLGRLCQAGVENLRCVSEFDPAHPGDEQHSWGAIRVDAASDCWIRQVTMEHFAGSAVALLEGCRRITVEDCTSLAPVSEIGGYRRHTFITYGQSTLFQRCRSEEGRHDFAVGALAAGPNVFLDCEAKGAHGFSGPIESWATGVLYDNITMDGGGLSLTNREIEGQGVGWASANSVLWQCSAPVITCRKPPGGENWAIGCWGQFVGDGRWQMPNEFVKPDSLYRGQLAERLGKGAVANLGRRAIDDEPKDAPAVEVLAGDLLPATATASRATPPVKPLELKDGWIVRDGKLLTGGRLGTTWWRGNVLPSRAPEFGVGVTRFVPGRDGPGFTDDLGALTDAMRESGDAILEHHWGLWYDRRRDDHQMIRRIDGDVWPPFYEHPWARSGQGTAWDGLSKYDLTAFNPWYFDRLDRFADECDRKGLVLLHQAYFQHNILEAGAHWADFPWRPANALQETGFPEPPPYENKKRVFMADAFYDVTHPLRRSLHRLYIRKCLDVLGRHPNALFVIGEEFTGPLEFARFWLDTVTDWERETGQDVLVGLSCTRDVQDAILADPARGPGVSFIEMKYWWYTADGSPYAPAGGQNLAPRQQYREWKGNHKRSNDQTARQVREYRDRYPDKAVVCAFDQADPWAIVAAGGSIPDLPPEVDRNLLAALPGMRPFEPAGLTDRQWALADPGRHYLVYSTAGDTVRLDLSSDASTFTKRWLDARSGRTLESEETVQGGGVREIPVPTGGPSILWLSR